MVIWFPCEFIVPVPEKIMSPIVIPIVCCGIVIFDPFIVAFAVPPNKVNILSIINEVALLPALIVGAEAKGKAVAPQLLVRAQETNQFPCPITTLTVR